MGFSHQGQKAGDNAQQIQAGTIIINNGISEERARAVITEMQAQARQEYTELACQIIDARMKDFEESLAHMIKKNEEDLSFFAEPSFQIALKKAQISAAKTNSKDDYNLLAELLDDHVKSKEDRKQKSAINKALEIIGEVDNQALCALTIFSLLQRLMVTTQSQNISLKTMDNLFEKLLYIDLPTGLSWQDHLDILGAVRISTIWGQTKFVDYFSNMYKGYVCIGIKNNSISFFEAIRILNNANIDKSLLVKNNLLDGYVRIDTPSLGAVEYQGFPNIQVEAFKKVFSLYENNTALIEKVKTAFETELLEFENIQKVKVWWDSMAYSINITSVGNVLATANLERITSSEEI